MVLARSNSSRSTRRCGGGSSGGSTSRRPDASAREAILRLNVVLDFLLADDVDLAAIDGKLGSAAGAGPFRLPPRAP